MDPKINEYFADNDKSELKRKYKEYPL